MNDSNNCCAQQVNPLEELRALETDLSTPEVTVPLEQYQKILDGITAHNDVLLRQKKAIESRLVSTRKFTTNFLEQSGARIRQLQEELNRANSTIEFQAEIQNLTNENAQQYIRAQDARIAELEAALRKGKRSRK